MRKNLILMISVCLILLMTLSVVSAGWFTGNAVKVSDSVKKYIKSGRQYTFYFDGEKNREYSLSIQSISKNAVNLRIGDEVTSSLSKGESYVFSDYPVKVTLERIFRKYAKVKIEKGESSGFGGGLAKPVPKDRPIGIVEVRSDLGKSVIWSRIFYGKNWNCVERVVDGKAYTYTTGFTKVASSLACGMSYIQQQGDICYYDPDVCDGEWVVGRMENLVGKLEYSEEKITTLTYGGYDDVGMYEDYYFVKRK